MHNRVKKGFHYLPKPSIPELASMVTPHKTEASISGSQTPETLPFRDLLPSTLPTACAPVAPFLLSHQIPGWFLVKDCLLKVIVE